MERSSPDAAGAGHERARLLARGVVVLLADVVTKAIACTRSAVRAAAAGAGHGLRFVLVYNPGAAFGLHLGPYSRWIFMVLTVGALVVLWRLYQQTRAATAAHARARAGVRGRARQPRSTASGRRSGVVDFIDVGLRATRAGRRSTSRTSR
jgi:signal peptidase II